MRTALVTGGTRGLGEAYAHELAARGYGLVLIARNGARLTATADRIRRNTGATVETLAVDLADPAGLAVVERRLAERTRPVDLLVNSAGTECHAVFADAPTDALTAEIDLNVTAVMRLTRTAVLAMTARGHGGIVNVASFAGYLPSGGNAYGATKAWVLAFTDTVAASLTGTGVTVTAVAAGRLRGQGDPTGPLWLEPADVVRRSLDDLDRGRTLSTPGWLYRVIVGFLESPRTALRAAARLAGRGRDRCARLERVGAAAPAAVAEHAAVAGTTAVPVPRSYRDPETVQMPVSRPFAVRG